MANNSNKKCRTTSYSTPIGKTHTFTLDPSGQGYISFDFDLELPFTADYDTPRQQKVVIGNSEGYECTDCKEFYPFAELNQPENAAKFSSFTCFGCRKGLKSYFKNK